MIHAEDSKNGRNANNSAIIFLISPNLYYKCILIRRTSLPFASLVRHFKYMALEPFIRIDNIANYYIDIMTSPLIQPVIMVIESNQTYQRGELYYKNINL